MAGGVGYGTLLRRRPFLLLWLAGGLTYAVIPTAMIVTIWTMTQAYPGLSGMPRTEAVALTLSFGGLSAALPTLAAATVAGALADTHPRLRLMRIVNALQIVAVGGLLVDLTVRPSGGLALYGFPAPVPWYVLGIFPCWAAANTAATLFRPALNASLPRIVGPAELGSANGLLLSFALALSFVGALASPLLLTAFGPAVALALPLGLLVAAQASLDALRAPVDPETPPVRTAFVQEIWEGYRYLGRQPALLRLTVAALATNFLSNLAFVELGLYVTVVLGVGSPVYLGILYAGANVGAAVGSLAVTRLRFEPRAGQYLAFLMGAQGATVVALGLIRWYPLAVVDLFLYGAIPGMALTVFFAIVQATVRNEVLGRVLAADEVGSMSLLPLGQYAGGLVTLAVGVTSSFGIAGAGILLTGAALAASPSIRRLGFRPTRPGIEGPAEADQPAVGAAAEPMATR